MGRGGIYFLPKNATMNGKRYQEVIWNHLLFWIDNFWSTHFSQVKASTMPLRGLRISSGADVPGY
jgi:hypothetical protein